MGSISNSTVTSGPGAGQLIKELVDFLQRPKREPKKGDYMIDPKTCRVWRHGGVPFTKEDLKFKP